MLSELEDQLGLPGLAARLGAALEASAEPSFAPARAAEVLAAAAAAERERLAGAWAAHSDTMARVLAHLCGGAPFMVAHLLRHPEWLASLASEDLRQTRTAQEYRTRLDRLLDGAADGEEGSLLREFKYSELARITVRELSADLVPEEQAGETLAELSSLADALLSRALGCVERRLDANFGRPSWKGPHDELITPRFCVLGLGKLGSQELNYSSDVDLIYVYESPTPIAESQLGGGPSGITPVEYFTRLAEEFGRLVSQTTADGFLYRVDLELRPEGQLGQLVVSSDALAGYYEGWAATWEKAAFMKARPVAGDLPFGWRTIRGIDPMIYRSTMDLAGVAAIREMKDKIERAKGRTDEAFHVKIGSGGIRDVEFVAQALQLLHGGRIPDIRERSTQGALVALAQVGVLGKEETAGLLSAYRFLRRTENRLQMEAERQTHRLPKGSDGLRRLSRSMGFLGAAGAAEFEQALVRHRRRIQEIFASIFPEGGERILELFSRNVPQLLAGPPTRGMIENLAGQFAREIAESANPERAMNNLDRFIQGVGRRRFYYELLLDRPELVPRLTSLFTASEYFSGYFAQHPQLIEPIFSDPNVLLYTREQMRDSLMTIRNDLAAEGRRDETELALDALRLFHNRELINVGLLDLGGKITLAEAESSLTDIAEVCAEEALAIAQAEMRKRSQDETTEGEFLVVGMGKLASHEITYGSDLDVIFLYDVPGAGDEQWRAQEHFVRLAQKFIWALRTRTTEGVCYDIDARLRPSGNQGTLVTSLAAFDRYHAESAQAWERQALLRARPVAGGARLAAGFEAVRLRILRSPPPPNLRQEIYRVRLRMESELAREGQRRHDFKTGRGGQHDIESVVQLLQLIHGAGHEELWDPDPIAAQLERLTILELLSLEDGKVLRDGWDFLRRLSSRLRMVENRSISDLDEERGDLDALARRLGYTSPQREGGARRAFLEDYRRHTTAVRAVYAKFLEA